MPARHPLAPNVDAPPVARFTAPLATPLAALLALMLPLALAWWLLVPPWEAPDGIWHWQFAAHLADGGGLPRSVEEARDAPWRQEGSQPPLYYALVALAVRPFDRSDAATAIRDNPHAAVGVAGEGGNVNRMIHPPRERFPWHGVARAARVAGLVSLVLALLAVAFTHAAARRLLPDRPAVALAAAATVALSPATLFFGTQVSNDIAALAAGAVVLWAMAALLDGGATARGAVILGAACGVAVLCKLNGLFLVPVACVVVLAATFVAAPPPLLSTKRASPPGPRTSPSPSIGGGGRGAGASSATANVSPTAPNPPLVRSRFLPFLPLLPLLPLLAFTFALAAVAAWWPLRNQRLFGDPTGLPLMWAVMPRRPSPPGLREQAGLLVGVWKSLRAVFGWYNLPAPDGVFVGLAVADVVGAVGVVAATWTAVRARSTADATTGDDRGVIRTVALCGAVVAALLFGVVLWSRVQFPQGRLLFSAVPAIAILLALGWGEVGRRTLGERRWPWLVAALWAALSAGLLATVVVPAYRAPTLVRAGKGMPEGATCCMVGGFIAAFDGGITLEEARIEAVGTIPAPNADTWYTMPPLEMNAHGSVDPGRLRPGDPLVVDLAWSAAQPITRDLSVFIHLVDRDGLVVAQHDSYPAAGRWATADWPDGGLVPDRHVFRLPPETAVPCDCTVVVGLYDRGTGRRVHGQVGAGYGDGGRRIMVAVPDDAVPIARLAIDPVAGPDGVPSPLRVRFGDAIELVGYRLPTRAVRAGETIPLTLYWRAVRPVAVDYKISVQLRRADVETWGQRDEAPADGARPTSGWRVGDSVVDYEPLPVYAAAPPGAYTLFVKLYDPAHDGLSVDGVKADLALAPIRVLPAGAPTPSETR